MAEPAANQSAPQLDEQIDALRSRIARWLLWVGLFELLFCAALLFLLHTLYYASIPELVADVDLAMRDTFAARLTEVQQLAIPIAVLVVMLGLLPAIGYLILGPAIRRGTRHMAMMAQTVLMLQIIILAGEVAVSLYNAIATGSPAQFSMRVVFVGTFVAVLVYIVQRLMELRQCQATLALRKGQPADD